MCFIPMQFGESNPTIPQANPRDTLHLPPVALAMQAAQTRQLTSIVLTADGSSRAWNLACVDASMRLVTRFVHEAGLPFATTSRQTRLGVPWARCSLDFDYDPGIPLRGMSVHAPRLVKRRRPR